MSVAYDLFGNGKTALKASASRGVEQESIAIAAREQPGEHGQHDHAPHVERQPVRTGDPRTSNFVPDCDLVNGAGNGECGAQPEPELRQRSAGDHATTRAIMDGWGVRPYNWEFSAGIQQELVPRVSLSFGYFRRINGNFHVTDNEALSRDRLHAVLSVTVPTDTTPAGLRRAER